MRRELDRGGQPPVEVAAYDELDQPPVRCSRRRAAASVTSSAPLASTRSWKCPGASRYDAATTRRPGCLSRRRRPGRRAGERRQRRTRRAPGDPAAPTAGARPRGSPARIPRPTTRPRPAPRRRRRRAGGPTPSAGPAAARSAGRPVRAPGRPWPRPRAAAPPMSVSTWWPGASSRGTTTEPGVTTSSRNGGCTSTWASRTSTDGQRCGDRRHQSGDPRRAERRPGAVRAEHQPGHPVDSSATGFRA